MKKVILGLAVAGLIVGCGGGNENTGSVNALKVGTFVDAPVQGLKYFTATQEGFTDKDGHFKYKEGEEIEFSLGSMHFGGKFPAKKVMTPYDVAKVGNTTAPIFFAMLMQSLDETPSDLSHIVISEEIANVQVSSDPTVQEFLAEAEAVTGHSYTMVDWDIAKERMDAGIAAFEYGNNPIGMSVEKIPVSAIKGYKLVIEDLEPNTIEVEFYCDGGYKLSNITPNATPWIRYEYHHPMMHVSDGKLYLHYINSYDHSTITDQYSITLFDNNIVSNESIYNPGTAFDYKLLSISKITDCN